MPDGGPPIEADAARTRFLLISVQRLIGAVLVMLGMLAMNGALDWGRTVGILLAIVGLIDFFLVPLLLARRWRSPRE